MPHPSVVSASRLPASAEVFSPGSPEHEPLVYLVVTAWGDRVGLVLDADEARAVAAALVAHADALT